jgi:pimeloyl-ACP methyl ester carboxylesterase
MKTDNQIKLKDGRALGYAEYGDPQGQPVIHFHGTPSCRLEVSRPLWDEIAKRLGVRLIVPDRPGIGLSDFKPRQTFLDWPDDVNELADALNLDRFAVRGLSAGGPYVAACAYKIPQRLTAAGIVSGIGPLDAPGAFDGMGKSDRQAYDLARKAPWLMRPLFWYMGCEVRGDTDKFLAQLLAELPEPDRAALSQEGMRELGPKMVRGAFQQGGRAIAREYILFTRPWGFRLEDIHMPVHLWHGEVDNMCPVSMGRYMAKTIPDCRARFIPDEGHLSLVTNHFEETLSALLN